MTDLLERLKAHTCENDRDCDEAAREIERLQAHLTRAYEDADHKSIATLVGPAHIVARFAHALDHILDDGCEENAQTGACTVEISKAEWTELMLIRDELGDDPHEVMHELIGVNDP